MRKYIQLPLIVLLLCLFMQPTSAADTEWKTYHSEQYKFSIDIPYDWKYKSKEELPLENSEIRAFSDDGKGLFMQVMKTPESSVIKSFNNLTAAQLDSLALKIIVECTNSQPGVKFEKYGTFYVNGNKCMWLRFQKDAPGISQKFLVLNILQNNVLCQMIYITHAYSYKDDLFNIVKSYNSLKFDID